MRRLLLAIIIGLTPLFWSIRVSQAADIDTDEAKLPALVEISEEDLQVMRMMELLKMMDFLKDMELLEGQKTAVTEDEK
jgi:hypothetical protein